MRRDGDLLLGHLRGARKQVLLCAPFIKAGVLRALLEAIDETVDLRVVTRWHAQEVAAGVSDLEVFDLLSQRRRTTLGLIDRLHAKLYMADDQFLAGSANLTATALGWCEQPNLEILTSIPGADPAVTRCLAELTQARPATGEERDRIAAAAARIIVPRLPAGADVTEFGPWLPRLAAPDRLYLAYMPAARDRLTTSTLQAADEDLRALDVPVGLDEAAFKAAVGSAFCSMPCIIPIVEAAEDDLTDEQAMRILESQKTNSDMPIEARWRIVRDWMTYFLAASFEIAPQTFVTRRRPGGSR
jgi:hypothetical protein